MRKSILILTTLMLFSFVGKAQLIKDRTNGKFTVGFDLFTDINMGSKYENFNLRSINQGFGTYLTYNFPMGESKHTVSLGAGVSCHNYYMKNAWLADPNAHSITFTEASVNRSKVNFNYMDIPMELNFRIADKFKISFGAKVSFLMSVTSRVIGNVGADEQKMDIKYRNVNAAESLVYSAFFRAGYRCVNLYLGYQFTDSFKKDRGPEILPFSIGIGIRAY